VENNLGVDLSSILEDVGAMLSAYGLKILGAIALLIVGRMMAGLVRSWVRKALERSKLEPTLIPFITGMTYYALMIFVLVAVLGLFGIQTTSFIAVLGAAGLAVGLALQGTLSNFAAGVMLLVFRPFKAGDFIEAGGSAGSVITVGVFSTTLHSPDNVRIILPNSSIFGQVVKNYSANDTRRNDMVIGISYSDQIGLAIETIHKVLGADNRVLKDPEPVVAVSELGDSSVNIVVRPWCRKEDYWGLRFDLTRELKEQLEAAGCSIPFPQTDVHFHKVGESGAA
jgi:small conductance mechanosensitive channel